AEGAHRFHGILSESLFAAFCPRADTETRAEVVAAGDFEGPLVRGVSAERARYATQRRYRRIVRVQSDPHLVLLSHRNRGADERGERFPDLLFLILLVER